MSSSLRKIIFGLWPPYEAYVARKAIDSRIPGRYQERMKSIQTGIRKSLPQNAKLLKETEPFARLVFESENERKKTLESKALAFISAFGVSVSVILVLPALFGKQWNIPTSAALVLGGFYVLTVIHLLAAVYYASDARRVEGFALPSADEFVQTLQECRQSVADRIVMYISQAKFNQPILLKKANSLAVAESMFIRGLILLTMTSTIGTSTILLKVGSTTAEICEVPDVVGLDQAAAKSMLVGLGLQPVESNQYDPNVTTGSVISQDPPAGSRMKPCQGDVIIMISLGPLPVPSPTPVPTHTPTPTKTPTPIPPTLTPTPTT
jgi:hypothetical protein